MGELARAAIRDLYRVPGAVLAEPHRIRCGAMWCDGSRGRKNGAYPVSVGEKKGACPVVHGIYLASFTLDKDLSHSSLLWLANVSMTIPSDFATGQLIEPVALQKNAFT